MKPTNKLTYPVIVTSIEKNCSGLNRCFCEAKGFAFMDDLKQDFNIPISSQMAEQMQKQFACGNPNSWQAKITIEI